MVEMPTLSLAARKPSFAGCRFVGHRDESAAGLPAGSARDRPRRRPGRSQRLKEQAFSAEHASEPAEQAAFHFTFHVNGGVHGHHGVGLSLEGLGPVGRWTSSRAKAPDRAHPEGGSSIVCRSDDGAVMALCGEFR